MPEAPRLAPDSLPYGPVDRRRSALTRLLAVGSGDAGVDATVVVADADPNYSITGDQGARTLNAHRAKPPTMSLPAPGPVRGQSENPIAAR